MDSVKLFKKLLKVLLRFLIKGTETGFIGEIANIIVGVSLVIPAAWIYNRNKSKKNINRRNIKFL